jgi:hypothetical protein
MDNILKTIFGVLAFAGVCILIANIINPPVPNTSADAISVQKNAETVNKSSETESTPMPSETPPMPAQPDPNMTQTQIPPPSASGGTVIDATNFGQPMMDPQPVMQLQNSGNASTPAAQPDTNTTGGTNDADGTMSSQQSKTEPVAN